MYNLKDKVLFVKELGRNMGNISRAIIDYNKKYKKEGELPLHRPTVYKWLKDPTVLENGMTFADYMEEIESKMIDDADSFLKEEAILKRNLKAICFLLKNKHPEYKQKYQIDTGDKLIADESIEKINALMEKINENKDDKTKTPKT